MLETATETVRRLLAEVGAFQQRLYAVYSAGQPLGEAQQVFATWVQQLQSRSHGYYGPTLRPTTEESTQLVTEAAATPPRHQTARRGRRFSTTGRSSQGHRTTTAGTSATTIAVPSEEDECNELFSVDREYQTDEDPYL